MPSLLSFEKRHMQRGSVLVVVLAAGDRRTQPADIKLARRIATD
jgi:putative component of toxin-antitoxin plasmid stabilization module